MAGRKEREEEEKREEAEIEEARRLEEEEVRLKAEAEAERQRVEAERKRVEAERKSREEQQQKLLEMQQVRKVEEQRRKEVEVINIDDEEVEEELEDNGMEAGPSVLKKRKLNEKEQVTLTMEENRPACAQCTGTGTICHRKMRGPGCWRCYQLKKCCSIVGGKKRMMVVEMPAEKVGNKGKGKAKKKEMDGMERLTEGLEMIGDILRKLVETQEGIRMAMEVRMRREEKREEKQENEWKEKEWNRVDKGVGTDKQEQVDDEEMEGSDHSEDSEMERALEGETERMDGGKDGGVEMEGMEGVEKTVE
ncbi:hypothetical protein BYT27DRAFT_7262704 [Phlegmacium glaucopus]|nr:hypothetical protein BYT27DRAFT_7262704 [Phlegmacium glaucopus]